MDSGPLEWYSDMWLDPLGPEGLFAMIPLQERLSQREVATANVRLASIHFGIFFPHDYLGL